MGVCAYYNSNNVKSMETKIKSHSETIIELFNEIQKSIGSYCKDIEEKNNLIEEFQSTLNNLNIDLNQSLVTMSISIVDSYKKENKKDDSFDVEKDLKLKELSEKIYDFKNIIEDLKINKLKKVEYLYELIQNSLNDDKYYSIIYEKLEDLEEINKYLKDKKVIHDKKKDEIEKDIEEIKKDIEEIKKDIEEIKKSFQNFVKHSESIVIESFKLNSDEIKISTRFLKNSMLLDLKESQNLDNIFKCTNLFKEDDNNENQECQNLLKKNWDEKCYIYDDYDLHDINYELKAVCLPPNVYYSSASFPFYIGTIVDIIEFEIEGKKTDYKYEEYSLKFKINLYNNESNKIHIKYNESPPSSKENEEENTFRKFYRNEYYGLSKDIKGQMAKYTFIIKCDFQVISFD